MLKETYIPTDEDRQAFIEDVARKCIADMTEEEKQTFRDDPDPSNYHFGYGMYIRNKYIRGKELPIEFTYDADRMSGLILERIIELVK